MNIKNWLISIDYFTNSKNNHLILFEDKLKTVEVTYSIGIGEINYDSLIKGMCNLVSEIHQDSCLGDGLHRYYKKPIIEFVTTSDLWRLPEPFYRESYFIDLEENEILEKSHEYFLELKSQNQISFEKHYSLVQIIKDFNGKFNSLSPEGRCFYAGLSRLKKAFLPIVIY